jgi:hypothetical protein
MDSFGLIVREVCAKSRVINVTSRNVSMVCRGFVADSLMMFGSFFMMASRVVRCS